MAIVTTIIDALRKFGSATQKSAIQRQDEQLDGLAVANRRVHVARSELGQATAFVATAEKEREAVSPLTQNERQPILENAALADAFVAAFLGHGLGDEFLDNLDLAFEAWTKAKDKKGYSSKAVIQIAGAAFGCFCVEQLGMRWVNLVDKYGSAIAIQGLSKDFRGFPFETVSKRIDIGEHGFFKPVYITLQETSMGGNELADTDALVEPGASDGVNIWRANSKAT